MNSFSGYLALSTLRIADGSMSLALVVSRGSCSSSFGSVGVSIVGLVDCSVGCSARATAEQMMVTGSTESGLHGLIFEMKEDDSGNGRGRAVACEELDD